MTKSKEVIARLQEGQFNRRQALKALGAMGFAVGAAPLGMRSALAADNATYFTWGGYDDDGMFAPYIAQHGGPPNYVTFGDAEEGFTKMKAGFVVDVTHPSGCESAGFRARHGAGASLRLRGPRETCRGPASR